MVLGSGKISKKQLKMKKGMRLKVMVFVGMGGEKGGASMDV